MTTVKGPCSHCGRDRRLRNDGTVWVHPYKNRNRCPGSGYPPGGQETWKTRALRAEAIVAAVESLSTGVAADGRVIVYLSDLNKALEVAPS